jgi:hypothetical protein
MIARVLMQNGRIEGETSSAPDVTSKIKTNFLPAVFATTCAKAEVNERLILFYYRKVLTSEGVAIYKAVLRSKDLPVEFETVKFVRHSVWGRRKRL